MNKHLRDYCAICAANGLTVLGVRHRGKHPAILCAEGTVTIPGTPSDHRSRHKTASLARRMARGAI